MNMAFDSLFILEGQVHTVSSDFY